MVSYVVKGAWYQHIISSYNQKLTHKRARFQDGRHYRR
jgi:hypothetical protein